MECNVLKEIKGYKEGVFLGLSMRQCLCAAGAIATAAGSYFGLNLLIPSEIASTIAMVLAAPFALAGFFTYQGLSFEQFLRASCRTLFFHGGWYVYRSQNLYTLLEQECQAAQGKEKTTDEIEQIENEQDQAYEDG